jgi:hypothetical protein
MFIFIIGLAKGKESESHYFNAAPGRNDDASLYMAVSFEFKFIPVHCFTITVSLLRAKAQKTCPNAIPKGVGGTD